MDKGKIMNELQQKMQETYLHVEVLEHFGALALKAGEKVIAWFRDWDPDHYFMECGPELTEWALSNSILLKFYEEGRRLLKKPIKKYRVKVLKQKNPNSPFEESYLGFNRTFNAPFFGRGTSCYEFTEEEIEKLKKRDDIAIDWDKTELEEVDNG